MIQTTRDDFESWLVDMDDALERFVDALPQEVAQRLDFTPGSLDALEKWILDSYEGTPQMLAASSATTVDGLARYIGETFRKAIGGRWGIRLDDPKYIFYGLPELIGYSEKPTSLCPISLATASADRRSGKYLSGVLASYIRDLERQGAG
jgi:hypothetical protein